MKGRMSKAFHVPADLAELALSLKEVQAIVSGRGRIKTLQRRIDRMPGNKKALEEEIASLTHIENDLIMRGDVTV